MPQRSKHLRMAITGKRGKPHYKPTTPSAVNNSSTREFKRKYGTGGRYCGDKRG